MGIVNKITIASVHNYGGTHDNNYNILFGTDISVELICVVLI